MASSAFYQAFVEIVPESKNLRRTLSKEFDSAGTEAGGKASKGINAGILGGIGKLAAPLAVAFAGLGIGRLLSDSISSASDLSEAGAAIEKIFGPASGKINTFAKGADKSLGQSNIAALDAAKSFGIFGQAAGLDSAANADFSIGLTGLAADLASFNNTTPEQAVEAIGAALRGESEPLRAYGVLLDDAALKAKALELGIYDGQGALTQQQRILAAEASIYDQTATARGDFADTSDGLANQQRILAAQFENTKAKLGESLLPAMTSLVSMANENLVPALDTLVEQVGPILADALTQSAPAFTALLEAIVPILPDLVTLGVEVLPVLVDLLIAATPAILAIVGGLTDFFGIIGTVSDFLKGDISFAEMKSNIEKIGGPLGTVYDGIMEFGLIVGRVAGQVIEGAKRIWQGIQTNLGKVNEFLGGIPGQVLGAVAGFGSLLFSAGSNLVQGLINGIRKVASGIADAVLAPVKAAVNGVKDFLGIRSPSRLMMGIGENTGEGLILGIQSKITGAQGALQSLVNVPNMAARVDASVFSSAGANASGSPIRIDQHFPQQDPVLAQRAAARENGRILASV